MSVAYPPPKYINMRFVRHWRRLPQRVPAEAAGLTIPMYCLVETGRILPTPEALERIAVALGYSAESGPALLREVSPEALDRVISESGVEA